MTDLSLIILYVDCPTASAAFYADWTARGLPIAQAPTTMDFGRTFVVLYN